MTVAVFSPFSATVALFCDSVDRALFNCGPSDNSYLGNSKNSDDDDDDDDDGGYKESCSLHSKSNKYNSAAGET